MDISIMNDLPFDECHLARLRALGELTIHGDTTSEDQAAARLRSAEIALVDGFKMPLNRLVIESAARLRLLALSSTAFHMVDLKAANERGVKVANVPGYATEAVAEHTIALMLAAVRSIPRGDAAMRAQPFQIDAGNPAHARYLGFELRGKTLGVVGLGAIGSRVAELGLGLGMKVLAYNRTRRPKANVDPVPLDDLLARSDVVSINVALCPETESFISDRELSLMKASAVLINTADGGCVSTDALYRALRDRRILAAGLDVLAEWDEANPLLTLDNVVLSPQAAFWTHEACATLVETLIGNVEAFVGGRPINLVN
jgi:lactate dehydrogenase-like 2-hydroxyacid dehydrogenase